MNCPNCGSLIGCPCQLKKMSDNKQGCSSCIAAYEESLNKQRSELQNPPQQAITHKSSNAPVITNVTYKRLNT